MGHTERDFCIVGGVILRQSLTLLYRSLDPIGGLAYDLTLIDRLGRDLALRWTTVTLFAVSCETQSSRGNGNEKLDPKLRKIFEL